MTIDELSNLWKSEIESIIINGYFRKIERVDYFKMNQNDDCYKITFNFDEGFSEAEQVVLSSNVSNYKINKENWRIKLITKFADKLEINNESIQNILYFSNDIFNTNEYIEYQGHRFIIQFYLSELNSKIREQRINNILNKTK